MRMPLEIQAKTQTAAKLRSYDLREYFSEDSKDFWTIHYRNRLDRILGSITRLVPPGGRILDIGCAQGTAAILLAERGYRVLAVDADPECINYARQRYEFGDCTFMCADVSIGNWLESIGGTFEAVILGEVLEHIPRPRKLLMMCAQALHPDGRVIVTTPNGESPHNWRFRKYNQAVMETSNREGMPSGLGGRETHLFNFGIRGLLELLRKCRFSIEHWEYLNSYVINPIGLHRLLSSSASSALNRVFARLPVLARFSTMTLFVIGKNPGSRD